MNKVRAWEPDLQPLDAASSAVPSRHPARYFLLNFAFIALIAAVSLLGDSENPRILYLCLLFSICSSPLLYVSRANGPYAILVVLLAFYFLCYSVTDIIALFGPVAPHLTGSEGVLSLAEGAVLLGAILLSVGYAAAAVVMTHRTGTVLIAKDWPEKTTIVVGLALWLLGIAATWMWASEVAERYVVTAQLSPLQAMGITAARYAQPVGVALIAYRFVMSRSTPLALLVLGILIVEFVFGFIADSKELSVRGVALVMVASFFLHGKIPKAWLGTALLLVVVTFPVFQAYRFEVLQEGKQTRTEGMQNLGGNLQTALQSDIATVSGTGRASGALGRLSLKQTMELIVARVGKDVSYQKGYTIGLFFAGFIPRVLWPDKPDSAVGQLFNRQFGISADPNTYISSTQLGELYWNFGWTGILVGMPLIGFLLGFVGCRCCLAEHKSITRFLLLAVTVYLICLRFEGGIAITYTQWIRSVALVLVLHFVFARENVLGRRVATGSSQGPEQTASAGQSRARVSFPNLMR